jgi:cellulose synthase/poly-beta-1,6-N-acetylglucosamine synthase-like glycosyltransferase
MPLAAMLPMVQHLNHALFVALLCIDCGLGLSYYLLFGLHLRFRRQGLAEEQRVLALPLPPDADLPDVLVQVPTFNEGALICRIGKALAQLDWPKSRLHVQVLDDSTGDSVLQSQRAVDDMRQSGVDAVLLHRTSRSGFKAGALAEGLARSKHEFVAMFDADYVPPRDFLRRCMRPLLHDAKLSLVQARCDYLNGDDNLVTFAQQRILDAHFAIEQASRSWFGQVVPFNGTCGIWRRAAIDAAGGWNGDTLAEDLDLSYRVQLRGGRVLFLTTVTVPGELPTTFHGWRRQQFRWTKGFAEVAKRMLVPVLRSDLSPMQKVVSSFHLASGAYGPLTALITVIVGAVDLTLGTGLTWLVGALIALLVIEGTVGQALMMLAGQRLARGRRLVAEAVRLPIVFGLLDLAGLANMRGAAEALFGYTTSFVRTPKLGVVRADRTTESD